MDTDIQRLQAALRRFAEERDWGQFHTPKNLATALSVEAAELLEHFQWLTDEQSRQLSDEQRQAVGHEIADVLLYLLQLSDKLGVDVAAAARDRLAVNAPSIRQTKPAAACGSTPMASRRGGRWC